MIPFISGLVGEKTAVFLVYGVVLVGAGLVGASLMANVKDRQIAELQEGYANERARAAQARLYELQRWQKRAHDAEAAQAQSEQAAVAASEEKERAIRRLTAGRPCLDGAVVRVLNQPAGLKPADLPTVAAEPGGADAGFATDTDVALWAASCRRHYDTCRGRIAAIAEITAEDVAP